MYDHWVNRMYSNLSPIQFLSSDFSGSEIMSNVNFFTFIRSSLKDDKINISSLSESEGVNKKSYDGSHIYNELTEKQQTNNNHFEFDSILNYSMNEFEYDTEAITNLEVLVSYLKSNNVMVSLVLSPYHPELYKLAETKKPIFLEIEDWYRNFAEKNEIRIIGSYDGALVGCNENEFTNGMHPKNSCMNKLFIK